MTVGNFASAGEADRSQGEGEPYDPATYVHWLMWDRLCARATHTEFQRLFEHAMQLLEGEKFTPIRSYGREGDRKADGILDGGETVFQVYSPNEVTVAKIEEKVDEDLPGAVAHWEEVIRKWVFVYNRRVPRGLAPQIVEVLNGYRSEYPDLVLSTMSDADLWDRLRDGLSYGDRSELLGPAMVGWGGAFVPPPDDPTEYAGQLGQSRVVILQPFDRPIDPADVMNALEPDRPFGPPLLLDPPGDSGWAEIAEAQRERVEEHIARAGDMLARFAVFSQAPIPLAIQLGAVLSDRVDTALFQYDRDRGTWCWDGAVEEEDVDTDIRIEGVPEETDGTVSDVSVRFSLSAFVSDDDVEGVLPEGAATVRVEVDEADVMWLRHPSQLERLEERCRRVWERIRRRFPGTERIHVFYAGPAPGAVVLGRSFNPRMNPPLHLYQYDRARAPRYENVLAVP